MFRSVWRWLTGADLRDYTFRHEAGPTHTVRARSEESARRKMRSFLCDKMFGSFALLYDPAALQRELDKCELIEEQQQS